MSGEHNFCRTLLTSVMEDVRKTTKPEDIKTAWAMKHDLCSTNPQFEFNGPNGYRDHDVRGADCLWSAKANGWMNYLETLKEKVEA